MTAVARQMGRLFGPQGGAVQQDVLAATGVGPNSSDGDSAVRVAYRKVKEKMVRKEGANFSRDTASRGKPMADGVLGIAARNIRFSTDGNQASPGLARLQLSNSEDPGTFLKFLAGALHFAVFPAFPRPQASSLFNCACQPGAWFCVSGRIKANLVGPS